MADSFCGMINPGIEPVPQHEIFDVTAMLYARAQSVSELSRLVQLAEMVA